MRILTSVDYLQLDVMAINKHTVEWIAGLNTLTHLMLQSEEFSTTDLNQLAQLKNLRNIGFSGSPLGDEVGELAIQLPKLSVLALGTKATGKTLELLQQSDSIENLIIFNCNFLTPDDYRHLALIPNLQSLSLLRHDLQKTHFEQLAKIPNLKSLSLFSCISSFSNLENLHSVEDLFISRSDLNGADLKPLAQMPALKVLKLEIVSLSADEIKSLAAMLPEVEIHSDFGNFNAR